MLKKALKSTIRFFPFLSEQLYIYLYCAPLKALLAIMASLSDLLLQNTISERIFSYLSYATLLNAAKVCRRWSDEVNFMAKKGNLRALMALGRFETLTPVAEYYEKLESGQHRRRNDFATWRNDSTFVFIDKAKDVSVYCFSGIRTPFIYLLSDRVYLQKWGAFRYIEIARRQQFVQALQ